VDGKNSSGRMLSIILLICAIILIIVGWLRVSPELVFYGMIFTMLGVVLAMYVESLDGNKLPREKVR